MQEDVVVRPRPLYAQLWVADTRRGTGAGVAARFLRPTGYPKSLHAAQHLMCLLLDECTRGRVEDDQDDAVRWNISAQGTSARCADIANSVGSIQQMQAVTVDELLLQLMRIWHQDSSICFSDNAACALQAACTTPLLTPADHQNAIRPDPATKLGT